MTDYDNTITELPNREPCVSIDPAADRIEELENRVAALSTALRKLIDRVEITGGYASPGEQDVLRRAKTVLASESER
jgi:hypothetical protein